MKEQKVLFLDEDTDKLLTLVCDIALKGSGIQVMGHVNQLAARIKVISIPTPENEIGVKND